MGPRSEEKNNYYIGLMSGTSIDGIDVALTRIDSSNCQLVYSHFQPFDKLTKTQLSNLCHPVANNLNHQKHRIELVAEIDVKMGYLFANAVNELLSANNIKPELINAIGSHGQTIRHRPSNQFPFSLQIGDPNIIATETQIATVADFRRMDIASGGQGAPLAPAFHNKIFRDSEEDRIILNLGGIANITYLPKDKNQNVVGFDTGTANSLLDVWYNKHHPNATLQYDSDSHFAKTGNINETLLKHLKADPYFEQPHPKSTGREYFSLDWLENRIKLVRIPIVREDVQRTLLEFTIQTIVDAIESLAVSKPKLLVCGGGMHNKLLLTLLSKKLNTAVIQTNDIGTDGDYLEAMTFAWLAKQRLAKQPGNIPSVTGASRQCILGCVYLP